MNECGSCNLNFSSVKSFDAHRVGKHAYLYAEGVKMKPPRYDGRRCLSVEELPGAGMAQDAKGRWGLVRDREQARKSFRKTPVAEATEEAE